MRIPLTDRAGLGPHQRRRLAAEVAGHTTLDRVLAWARGLNPAVAVADIVTQDEYTHDVILKLDPSRYLVYDVS